jgi:hypothetical protein
VRRVMLVELGEKYMSTSVAVLHRGVLIWSFMYELGSSGWTNLVDCNSRYLRFRPKAHEVSNPIEQVGPVTPAVILLSSLK